MLTFDQKRICLRAIAHWGAAHQAEKAKEAMGELITELSRLQDKRTSVELIRGELADVMILCEQLRIIYGQAETDKEIERKLDRLWRTMGLSEGRRP